MSRILVLTICLACWAGLCLAAVPLVPKPRDLTLEESLRLATEGNLRVQSTRFEAAAFAEEVPKAFKDFLPKLRSDLRYFVQGPRPVIAIPPNAFVIPPIPGTLPGGLSFPAERTDAVAGTAWDYYMRIRLDQPLFTGFRLSSTYAVAKIDKAIGTARLTRVQHDTARFVKLAFFAVLKANEERQAAEARIQLQQAEIRYTESSIAGGRATANALPPLRAMLAAFRQEALETGLRAQVAQDDLKRLIGMEPGESIRLVFRPEERVVTLDADEAARIAQGQSPDLREVSFGVDRAREGITLARSGYYPRIGLFGSFEKQKDLVIHPLPEILTAGVEANWTFWEWGRTNHERAQAELRHHKAVIDLKEQQAVILQQVRITLADVRAAEGRVTALREEIEAARTALKIAEERFRDKVGVERDVTVARFDLTRALAQYRAGIYEAYIAHAHLQRNLGLEQLPTEAGRPIQTSTQEMRAAPLSSAPARISPTASTVAPSRQPISSRQPASALEKSARRNPR
jgi:outer membrane protein